MGALLPLNVQAGRSLLRWRTLLGRTTAIRHLDLLAVAIAHKGYRHIKLYQADEFPTRPPVLWVFAFGPDDHVRVAVNVQAVSGGGWAYYEAGRGRHGYLCPGGDSGTVISAVRYGRSCRTGWSKLGRPPIWPASSAPLCPARVPTPDPSRMCGAPGRPPAAQTAPGRPRSPPPGNRRDVASVPGASPAGS